MKSHLNAIWLWLRSKRLPPHAPDLVAILPQRDLGRKRLCRHQLQYCAVGAGRNQEIDRIAVGDEGDRT